jgi:hypothetical protein
MVRREEEIRAVERRGWKKSSNPVKSGDVTNEFTDCWGVGIAL